MTAQKHEAKAQYVNKLAIENMYAYEMKVQSKMKKKENKLNQNQIAVNVVEELRVSQMRI